MAKKLSRLAQIHAVQRMIEKSSWGKYFGSDLSSFLAWCDLPGNLLNDLQEYLQKRENQQSEIEKQQFDDASFQMHETYDRDIARMLGDAGKSTLQLPYHNIGHFQRAYFEARQAIEKIEDMAGRELPKAVKQAFYLGVAGHDHHHTGSTFLREEEKSPLYRSVEGRSAHVVDDFLKGKAYNPLARAFTAYTIWASTFGGEKIGIEVKPHGFFGLLMRTVDVLPSKDFVTAVHDQTNLMYGETPAVTPPEDEIGLIRDRLGFIDHYIDPTLKKLNESNIIAHLISLFPEVDAERLKRQFEQRSLTQRLGWDDRLDEHRKSYERALIEGTHERDIVSSSMELFDKIKLQAREAFMRNN